jgi:chromosome segregation ATPase
MTTRQLPTIDEVRLAMDLVLREAAESGHRPTITAVERQLEIAHPTFYRNYPELIAWFKQRLQNQRSTHQGETQTARKDPAAEIGRLRRENEDLRTLTKLYAEAIRQLTLAYAELEAKLNAQAGVTPLDAWRNQH